MTLDKTLRYIVYGGIFVLPFIPFVIFDGFFFPFIVGKNIAFRIIVGLMTAAWGVHALRHAAYRPKKSVILWSFFVFVAVMFVANLAGRGFVGSFWSNYERMEGFVTILYLAAYIVVLGSVMTRTLWTRLLNTTVVASVCMGLYGLLQLAGSIEVHQGAGRLDGTFGNATYLAAYMLFHIFITLFLLLRRETSRWLRVLYVVAIMLQGIVLYFTATRGTILGLIGGLFVTAVLVVLIDRERPRLRHLAVSVIAIILLVLVGFFAVKDAPFMQESPVLKRFANISLEERTTRSRFVLWEMTLAGVQERPVLGWGQENFGYVFDKHYDPRMFDQEQWFDRAHNVVLDWFVSGGVLGLLAYLSLFGSALFLLWKRSRFSATERAIFTGLLAGYFFHNLFVFDNVASYLLFGTVLALIHQTSVSETSDKAPAIPMDTAVVNRMVAPFWAVLIVVLVYLSIVPGMRANGALLDALRVQGSDPERALSLYERALSYGTYGGTEVREQLIGFAQASRNNEAIPDELKMKIFTTAEKEMRTQIAETPERARPYLFLGSLFGSYGRLSDAEDALREAVRLSPQKQSLRFTLIDILLAQGRASDAVALAKETYELLPEAEPALKTYAATLIMTGRDVEARTLLQEQLGSALIAEDVFINAYAARGDLATLLELWRLRVEENPRDLQARVSYAATLIELGRHDEAIAILEQARVDFPDFSDRGQEIINALRSGEL